VTCPRHSRCKRMEQVPLHSQAFDTCISVDCLPLFRRFVHVNSDVEALKVPTSKAWRTRLCLVVESQRFQNTLNTRQVMWQNSRCGAVAGKATCLADPVTPTANAIPPVASSCLSRHLAFDLRQLLFCRLMRC
jgi:hypothetical protein